jgi:DNA topoisomerase I
MGRLRHVSGWEPGLRRVRRGKGFSYEDAEGRRVGDEQTLARIRSLAIPPAWTDVWICADAHGHLQATGTDARGRKQYRYHPTFRAACEAAKFEALVQIGRALPKVREAVDRDLRKTSLGRERVLAAVVRTIELTGIRIGSEAYTRDNGSFGATTLRVRHARFEGVSVRLRFRGKSGIVRSVSIDDPRVVRVLKHASGLPGETLFAWVDAAGRTHRVRAGDVNRYLREAAGCRLTAKDLRTWTATVHLAEALSIAEQAVLGASLKEVARTLGHTPAVCRKSYIHPAVIECHKAGSLRAMMRRPRAVVTGLRPAEVAVLSLLTQWPAHPLNKGPSDSARPRPRHAA